MPSQQPTPSTVVVWRTPGPLAPPPPAVTPTTVPTIVNVTTPAHPPPPRTIHVRSPPAPQAPPHAATPVIPEFIARTPPPPSPVVIQVPPSPAPPRHAVVQVISSRLPDIEINPATPTTQSEEMVPEPIHVPPPSITVPAAVVQVGMGRPTPPPPFIVVRNPRSQGPEATPKPAQPVRPLTEIAPLFDGGVPEGMPSATQFQEQAPSIVTVSSPYAQALPAASPLPIIPPPASLVEIPGSIVQNRAVVRVPNPFPAVQDQLLEAAPTSPPAPLVKQSFSSSESAKSQLSIFGYGPVRHPFPIPPVDKRSSQSQVRLYLLGTLHPLH